MTGRQAGLTFLAAALLSFCAVTAVLCRPDERQSGSRHLPCDGLPLGGDDDYWVTSSVPMANWWDDGLGPWCASSSRTVYGGDE